MTSNQKTSHSDMPPKDKAMRAAYDAARYLKNRERVRAMQAAYRLANLDAEKERHRAWTAANPERNRARKVSYKKRHPDRIRGQEAKERAAITDGYMRRLICKAYRVKCADVPAPLVEVSRELLKLKRELRDAKR